MRPIRMNDRVYDATDPRHIGRVERLLWGHHSTAARIVRVRWEETGWLSDVPASTLEIAR